VLGASRPFAPDLSGHPLPDPLRQRMERSFGHDFSSVRVYASARPATAGADALTRGEHLHFRPGAFRPETQSGRELIGHELEETVDAEVSAAREPEEVAEEIEHLLDEIVETYEAGDADAAAELSAEAYLENYEVIEAGVIDAAPDINEELEPLLGADLRKAILEGVPAEDVAAMVEQAKTLLAQALEALEGAEH
jgi:hypothetical protein